MTLDVVPFILEIHLEAVLRMLYLRNSPIPPKASFPEHGCVVYRGAEPVAAAFLRRVEGGYAQLDGLVSSPVASSEMRHEAITLAVDYVLDQAQALGITQIMAISTDAGTLLRSERHGFAKLPHAFIALDLKSRLNTSKD